MPGFNLTPGGESSLKLNVFAQPDIPTDKFDGVLLQTTAKETIKKVVFDTNVWASGQWQNPCLFTPPANSYITGHTGSYYQGKFYLIGATSFSYNPNDGTTTTLAPHPLGLGNVGQVTVGNKIYCFGGQNAGTASTKNYVYDIGTNTFTEIHASTTALYDITGCYSPNDNCIYCVGGISTVSSTYLYIFKYDIENNTQTNVATYPTSTSQYGLENPALIFFNNSLYIFGGWWSHSGTTDGNISAAFALDLTTYTFTEKQTLPFSGECNGFLLGDNVLLANTDKLYSYDMLADTYSELDTSPSIIGLLAQIGNIIFSVYNKTVNAYMLTAKQYSDSLSVIFYRLNGDITHTASIIKGKLVDNMPINFKDCMLFKDGDITFPALYIGDGSSAWNLARAAQ